MGQGSALSPILSALYIAPLICIFEHRAQALHLNTSILLFVDNGFLTSALELVLEKRLREFEDSPTCCELSWRPEGSVGFLFKCFGIFELTMMVVKERGYGWPVTLKALNVRNMVVLIKLSTTDCWLGVARPIPSLILLERLLQLEHPVLTLSSV